MFCEKIIELVYWMHSPWLSNPIGAGLLSDTEGYRPGSEPPGATSTKHTKVFFNNKENVLQLHIIQKTFWRNKIPLYTGKCKIFSKEQVFTCTTISKTNLKSWQYLYIYTHYQSPLLCHNGVSPYLKAQLIR